MNLLVSLLFLLAAALGTGVALSRTPRRQVMAMAANGLVLALLFMALQAPDVAFSELTVGAVALPLLFLVVLASMRMDRRPLDSRPGTSHPGDSIPGDNYPGDRHPGDRHSELPDDT